MRILIIAIVFVVALAQCNALKCTKCDKSRCKNEPTNCPYGFGKEICSCCDICAKGLGESCGGLWNSFGSCGGGFTCKPNAKNFYERGQCV